MAIPGVPTHTAGPGWRIRINGNLGDNTNGVNSVILASDGSCSLSTVWVKREFGLSHFSNGHSTVKVLRIRRTIRRYRILEWNEIQQEVGPSTMVTGLRCQSRLQSALRLTLTRCEATWVR